MSNRQSRQKNKDEGAGDSDHGIPIQPKQSHCDPEQATISGLKNVMKGVWTNDHELYFEPFLRRVVREEVERKFRDHLCPRATVTQADASRATPLELRFINKLPDLIFTHTNMVAEDKTPIQIALFYVGSQSVVNVGPLSSIKIEICALNGDFGFNGGEDRTEHEFNVNILRERDGKRPLLNGDRFITLKNGVGCINKLMFTDNSRWIRSGKFRLGAKAVQRISNEINIKEGVSEPFKVKDYRANKKHYPPSLNDEVWRLEQIAKDGNIHKRLSSNGILTVQDLLRLYTTNTSSLVEVLGSISKRSWQSIIEHAKTCVIDDDKLYIYHTAEQSIGLFFNSIYVLVGVIFDEQNFRSLDTLTHSEKHSVEMLKQHAYNNVNNIKPIDETSLSYLRPLACLGAGQSKATEPGLQDFNAFTAQEGYGQLHASTSYIGEGVHNYQTYADPLPNIRDMPLNGESWTPNGSHLPVMQGDYLMENDGSHIQFTNCPPCTTWGQENGFYNMRPDFSHSHFFNSTVSMSSKAKPKTLWYKIRSAFKYVISVRRDAAAKRNAKLLN